MKIIRGNDKDKGVSEVLGSLLVLAITVTLFSSVFYYVATIPAPNNQVYAQFNAKLNVVPAMINNRTPVSAVNITVKNIGGESLQEWSTMFIVMINNVPYRYYLSNPLIADQPTLKKGVFSAGTQFYYNSTWNDVPANSTTNISLYIYSTVNKQIIWSESLQGYPNIPPVVVGLITSPTPLINGQSATFTAILINPQNPSAVNSYTVNIDLKSIGMGTSNPMSYSGQNEYTSAPLTSVNANNGIYPVYVSVKYSSSKPAINDTELVTVGAVVTSSPSLSIQNIQLATSSPTHNSTDLVTVYVINKGGAGAKFNMSVYEQQNSYQAMSPINKYLIESNLGDPMNNFFVSAGGETTISFNWINVGLNSSGVSNGPVIGPHYLIVTLKNITLISGNSTYPNVSNQTQITILPKILLVNDDQATSGSKADVIPYYEFALSADNFQYTVQTITGSNIISAAELAQYDVVIWTTGYSNNQLSYSQLSGFYKFYSNGGDLWLISAAGISESSGFPYFPTTTPISPTANISTISELKTSGNYPGNYPINITNSPTNSLNSSVINLVSRSPNSISPQYISSSSNSFFTPLFSANSNNNTVVGAYLSGNGKIIFQTFELANLNPIYWQSFLMYRVINWFTGSNSLSELDLAAADMIVTPITPLYHQNVTISVAVRNNGNKPVNNVYVALYLDGQYISNNDPQKITTIPSNGQFTVIDFTWLATVTGTHSFSVMVDPYDLLGEQNRANNLISSSSIVNTAFLPISIKVGFSTLIINNGTNSNNLNSIINVFKVLGYNYTYPSFSSPTLVNGYSTGKIPASYFNGSYFSNYNLVIWISGDKNNSIGSKDATALYDYSTTYQGSVMFVGTGTVPSLTSSSINGLGSSYTVPTLQSVIVKGEGILNGINYVNGIDNITRGMALIYDAPSSSQQTIYNLTSGTNSFALFSSSSFKYAASNANLPILEQQYMNLYSSTQHSGYGIVGIWNKLNYSILPFDINDIVGIFAPHTGNYQPTTQDSLQAQAWLMYMLLQWYGFLDDRAQLEINSVDINYNGSMPVPVIGHSYVLSATVRNIGYQPASVLVQFYQDYELIGSQNVQVNGKSAITTQVMWTPMFAGERYIRVVIDPYNQVPQIMANGTYASVMPYGLFHFLNEGIINVTVYYFWDNMESGTFNWNTETTLLNINGEGPFSFISASNNVATNVQYIPTLINVSLTQNFSYSPPNSYYFREVTGTNVSYRPPLDLAFVIDFSGSMSQGINGQPPKYHLVQKAFSSLIWNQTGPNDRVTVFIFTTGRISNEFTHIVTLDGYSKIFQNNGGFIYMTNANKKILTDALNYTQPGYGTPFWSTLGLATNYVLAHSRPASVARSAIISMTDGDDNGVWGKYPYSPLGIWNQSLSFSGSGSVGGFTKYQLNDPTLYYYFNNSGINEGEANWYYEASNSSVVTGYNYAYSDFSSSGVSMKGILFAPIPIFTIGIGVLPYNPLYNNSAGYNSPLNWTEQTVSSTNGQSYYMSASGDLWDVAWTSGARYFYSNTGQNLPQIFSAIYLSVATSSGGSVLSPHTNLISNTNASSNNISPSMAIKSSNGQYMIFYDGFHNNMGYWYYSNYGNIFGKGWWTPDSSWEFVNSGDITTQSTSGTLWSPRIMADGFTSFTISLLVSSTSSSNTLTLQPFTSWYLSSTSPYTQKTFQLSTTMAWVSYTFSSTQPLTLPNGDSSNSADNGLLWFELTYSISSGSGSISISKVYVNGTLSSSAGFGKPVLPPGPTPIISTATGISTYRTLLTPAFSIQGASTATLTFWQKYWILTGQNGGVITVGTSNASSAPSLTYASWNWNYIMPETPYSGNLNLTDYRSIAHLPEPWAFNGASAGGTFGWEQVVVNLTQFTIYKWIIVNFTYWQFGVPQKTSPYDVYRGWYLDNIQVEVTGGPYQYWALTNASDINELSNPNYYGITNKYSNYWMFSNYTNTQNHDTLPLGVDSALITKQIDLSNAYNATLNAYFKFNINNASGLPPEIIRVEVSDNDGQSWTSITYGVRIGWNLSGTGGYAGTSPTGKYGWVNGNTLQRLSTDLSGWAGQTILIKFRVITNSLSTYQQFAPNGAQYPLAVFIGDVSVTGVGSAAVDYPSWGLITS